MPSAPVNLCCDARAPHRQSAPGGSPSALLIPDQPRPKNRVLFVDDEQPMLRVLTMGMRSMTSHWDMEFASSGEEALTLARKKPFDVVVTDMRMSGMNGAQLLNHIFRLSPQTVRIVLSGYSDLSEVVNCVGLTHQFLGKPCSLEDLRHCIKHVTEVKSRLQNDRLAALVAGLKNLPSVPELYLQIADVLQSPNASSQRIAELAAQDPALSAKLLQLSNSAFFGFSHQIFSVEEAVQLLGVTVIQTLSLAVPLFSGFDRRKFPSFPIDQLWHHSAQTGALGRQLFKKHLEDQQLLKPAFAAGVLHDIGKLILADGLPAEYAQVYAESQETATPLHEVERKQFGATHAEVGDYLLALWGLPIPLVEAVACHHHPHRCGNKSICLAGIVHIANALQHAQAKHANMVPSPVSQDYLKHLNLAEQFEAWQAELTE